MLRNPLWKRLPGQLIVDGNAPSANSPIPMRPLLSICKQGGGGAGRRWASVTVRDRDGAISTLQRRDAHRSDSDISDPSHKHILTNDFFVCTAHCLLQTRRQSSFIRAAPDNAVNSRRLPRLISL